MRPADKRKVREQLALNRIKKEVKLDIKLLRQQIDTLSDIINITNDDISDRLIGAIQILEMFEWLPKGEYRIKFKIE